MKKILSLMLLILFVALLSGCNGEKTYTVANEENVAIIATMYKHITKDIPECKVILDKDVYNEKSEEAWDCISAILYKNNYLYDITHKKRFAGLISTTFKSYYDYRFQKKEILAEDFNLFVMVYLSLDKIKKQHREKQRIESKFGDRMHDLLKIEYKIDDINFKNMTYNCIVISDDDFGYCAYLFMASFVDMEKINEEEKRVIDMQKKNQMKDTNYYLQLAKNTYYKEGDYNKSVINKALELEPTNGYIYLVSSEIQADRGIVKDALKDLEKAIQLEPKLLEENKEFKSFLEKRISIQNNLKTTL